MINLVPFRTWRGPLLHKPVKSIFFKNRELYWSNLPQNSNCGHELVQKSGVQILVREGQILFVPFSFHFHILHKKWILNHKIVFFIFFYQLNINKNRCMYWTIFNLFLCNLLIYKKGSLSLNIQFFTYKMKKVKKKRRMAKQKIWPSSTGIRTPDFLQNFPAQDLSFEGD